MLIYGPCVAIVVNPLIWRYWVPVDHIEGGDGGPKWSFHCAPSVRSGKELDLHGPTCLGYLDVAYGLVLADPLPHAELVGDGLFSGS